MSKERKKEQQHKENIRRERDTTIPFGQRRVRVIKPIDPNQERGQKRVVRPSKDKSQK
jgi:hypothetical protein